METFSELLLETLEKYLLETVGDFVVLDVYTERVDVDGDVSNVSQNSPVYP